MPAVGRGKCATCRNGDGYVEATGAVHAVLELAGRALEMSELLEE